jgi:hypothetical protein
MNAFYDYIEVKNIIWMSGEISILTTLNYCRWLDLIQEDEH